MALTLSTFDLSLVCSSQRVEGFYVFMMKKSGDWFRFQRGKSLRLKRGVTTGVWVGKKIFDALLKIVRIHATSQPPPVVCSVACL